MNRILRWRPLAACVLLVLVLAALSAWDWHRRVEEWHRMVRGYVQTLAGASIAARAAASAEEAMRVLERERVGMVVSDVRMPGDDGIALLRRARERLPGLPFLLVTAFADVRQAVDALKLGAVDYRAKPVDLDELLAAVRDTLGLPQGGADAEVPPALLAGIVAESPAFRAVMREAYLVASSDAPVLVTGESGTGK
ncbi:MAG: response regulator, partial [Polyangiaceae bacterium]